MLIPAREIDKEKLNAPGCIVSVPFRDEMHLITLFDGFKMLVGLTSGNRFNDRPSTGSIGAPFNGWFAYRPKPSHLGGKVSNIFRRKRSRELYIFAQIAGGKLVYISMNTGLIAPDSIEASLVPLPPETKILLAEGRIVGMR